MAHVEFTIEPFVEGRPGPHVTAAIDAARSHGAEVEVGPFGSSCTVDLGAVGDVVRSVTAAAFDNGASHVSVHVARDVPSAPPAFAPERSR
ncbi:MAG TPA: thiamine-binding protein [Ilumatobacteraceae bacterium]|nr:thiamine-binding protein [Ilumatobacteraceae bacterium]